MPEIRITFFSSLTSPTDCPLISQMYLKGNHGRYTECDVEQPKLLGSCLPAWAGKTHNAAKVAHLPGDHSQVGWLPPSCVPYHYFENNSSPRGRGKQDQSPRTHPTPRLIPAWAEKTAAAPGPESQPRAHPRAGGENITQALERIIYGGSSPRGRGKRYSRRVIAPYFGLIPARAGKTPP